MKPASYMMQIYIENGASHKVAKRTPDCFDCDANFYCIYGVNFYHAAMETKHLLKLAELFADHIRRSLMTAAKRAGVHGRTFVQMQQGLNPRVDTFNRAYAWFDANWPADLQWPADVPRPSTTTTAKGRAA